MTLLEAIVLGVVEGVTEFLPISSTGHLILVGHLLGIKENIFSASFDIIIQLGAILAVVVLYWRSFFDLGTLKKILTAFVPTGIIGLLFYQIIKTYFLHSLSLVAVALFAGGVFIIFFDRWQARQATSEHSHGRENIKIKENSYLEVKPLRESMGEISYQRALIIGLFQAVAIIPGVSRSAATIIGGLWLGLPRALIVEFSFLLAVPTMVAATGFDLWKNYHAFALADWQALALGFFVSFGVALLSIRWLLAYVRQHNFSAFGWYRIIIAALFFLLIF